MKTTRAMFSRDDGMTIIEILVASIILFFAITAVLGLIAASTRINVQSTQQVIVVNRVQSYIEEVRRMGWTEIGVVGGAVPGALPAYSHFVEAGYDVTVTPTVTWIDDPRIEGVNDYKLLRVEAAAAPVGGSATPYTYVVETYIRESDANRPEDTAPPEIEFESGSPDTMQVLSGTNVGVYAHAWTPMESGLLQSLRFYCDSRTLRDSGTSVAEWTLEDKDVSRSFAWDTTRIDEDGIPYSPDGVRQIKVETWDNVGQKTYRIRQVILDNYPPSPVGSVSAEARTDVISRLSWPFAMDGPTVNGVPYATDPAAGYRVHRQVEGIGGTWTTLAPEVVGNITAYDHESLAFSRYDASVVALSPTGMESAATRVERPYISRSLLRGNFTNTYSNGNKYCMTVISFSLSTPKFGYTTVSNVLYRSASSNMSAAVPVATGSSFTSTNSYYTLIDKSGLPGQYYYQSVSTIRPSGLPDYASNPIETVKSNIIGPVSPNKTGVMPTAGW